MADAVPKIFACIPTSFFIFSEIAFCYLSGRLQDFCISSSTRVNSALFGYIFGSRCNYIGDPNFITVLRV